MEYLQLMFILVGLSTCTRCVDGVINGDFVEFNTTKPEYNVGDNVTLTCYVDNWLLVTFIRNDSDLGDCYAPPYHVCTETVDMRTVHTNYGFKLNKTCAWLEIKNVSKYDSGVDFACHWTSYREHVSFLVIDKPETQNTDIKDKPTTGATGIVIYIVVGAIIALVLVVVTVLCCRIRYIHRSRSSLEYRMHFNAGGMCLETEVMSQKIRAPVPEQEGMIFKADNSMNTNGKETDNGQWTIYKVSQKSGTQNPSWFFVPLNCVNYNKTLGDEHSSKY